MQTAAERRADDAERERRIAELASVIRDTFPEIGPEVAAELARKKAAAVEAARPDGVAALLAEFAALGVEA